MYSALSKKMIKKTKKLVNIVNYLQTRNVILKAKIADLQETVYIEKSKKKREKPLFDLVDFDNELKVMFFSFNKI